MPTIALFSLGGTIACAPSSSSPGAGVTPLLSGRDLIAGLPGLAELAEIETVAFRQCPSGDLTVADLVELAARIDHCLAAGAVGAVVTQGTDTLEETAYALSLLVRSRRPVAVTGAMRNPTLPGADGAANLLAAVTVAARTDLPGCVVVMNDEIHDPRYVRKAHTTSTGAFRSEPAGPIGWLCEGDVHLARPLPPTAGFALAPEQATARVALVTAALGDDGALLRACGELGYHGVVIAGFGGGHVPSPVAAALGQLTRTMPVVLTSRTGCGPVLTRTYDHPGSERDLLGRGVIGGGILDGPKARVLLTLLLAGGAPDADIRHAFARLGAAGHTVHTTDEERLS
jgi:L-asparaginase